MKRKNKNRIENVQPLRSEKEIDEIILGLRIGGGAYRKREELAKRDILLFLFGINTGLRVSDIVKLKVKNVRHEHSFIIYEGKTEKRRVVNISMLKREIEEYTKDMNDEDYLFPSQRDKSFLSTTQVYRILRDAGKYVGREDIGTHTMRKTFGYHHYQRYKDVAILQEIFNHSSPSITMRYIGITEDDINKTLDDFRLG